MAPPVTKRLKLPPPLTFLPAQGETLTLDGKGFRGRLVVARTGKTLRIVMEVSLDAYVMGIVPGEMPKEWPLEALKTQAVAARTYAVANFEQGKDWDVVSDPQSFAYYGVAAESPATTQAVRQTHGQVLTYRGKVITAFYFSSSGGRTLSAQDVFGVALSYLPGSADPWDEASPNHSWPTRSFSPSSLATGAGDRRPTSSTYSSYRARPVDRSRSVSRRAPARACRAARLRRACPTRPQVPELPDRGAAAQPPSQLAAEPGPAVSLDGLARDVGPAVLEQRGPDGVWKPARKLALRPDGAFSLVLRPPGTAAYRVVAAGLIGPSVVVKVVPARAEP